MSCLKARNSIAFVSEVSIEYLKRALKIGSMARKEVLKMAFVNMFNDRVEQFNLREENERLAELFSDEKLQEEAQWQAYSVKEIFLFLSNFIFHVFSMSLLSARSAARRLHAE